MAYIETSALNAKNVNIAFKNLIHEIYKITKQGKFNSDHNTDGAIYNNMSTTDVSKPKYKN